MSGDPTDSKHDLSVERYAPVVTVLAMFPLGTVLFPGMFLPLHVFEPRYRSLTTDVLAADREFGVVLIERGNEVGGGDVRTDIGTVARIVEHREMPDGRWALATVGVRRIRVERWLADDPYPRAEVVDLDGGIDARADDHGPSPEDQDTLVARFRRALALATELGHPAAPATIALSEDLATASFQMAALAPLTPMDKQQILATDGVAARVSTLAEQLSGQIELLEARLSD